MMKQYNVDWRDFLQRLSVWDKLTLETRRILFRLKGNKGIKVKAFGQDLSLLTSAEFLTLNTDGKSARLHTKALSFGRGLRAMGRHDILADPSVPALREYIRETLTSDEQTALSPHLSHYYGSIDVLLKCCQSADWLLDFVAIKGLKESRKWESLRLPRPYSNGRSCPAVPMLSSAPRLTAAQSMIRELMLSKEPVPFQNLAKRLKIRDSALLATAIGVGIRYLFLFPSMRLKDMTPVLTVWPPIAERMNRPPAKRPKSVLTDKTFCCALLMEDMTTALVAATGEAPRIRQNDFGLFAKAAKQYESKLMPLPNWFGAIQGCTTGGRLDAALDHLKSLHFLVTSGTIGKDFRLEPTPESRTWLGLSAKERLKYILDQIKSAMPAESKHGGASVEANPGMNRDKYVSAIERELHIVSDRFDDYDDADDYDDDDDGYSDAGMSSGDRRTLTLLTRTPNWASGVDLNADVLPAAVGAFATLAGQRFVPLTRFIEYQVRHANPLLQPRANGKPIRLRIDWTLREPTPEEAEACWADLLGELLYDRLLPLGCVEIGIAKKDGEVCVALTDVGRYFLGRAKDFAYGTSNDQEGHIVVQPNFDVVFMAPSPLAEAALARFAERTGSGAGTLFKITRKSIMVAASSHMTAKATLETLRDISAKPVPDNVAREIQGWFDRCRRISIQPAILIHCPDAATATQVLAAGGKTLQSISDTVVELTDPKAKTALVRKLKQAGVFVDQSPEPAVTRRPQRRGRRRRWGW